MSDFTHDIELVKHARRNAEEIPEFVRGIESKLAEDPAGAKDFIRPCSVLLQKLLEAQAAVEVLLQKLYAADRLEFTHSRR